MTNITFTPEELILLSDALILSLRDNSEAMKHITSSKAKAALEAHLDELRDLNSKICLAPGEALLAQFHAWEEKRTPPRVIIEVECGLVQNVYADADVDVTVYGEDIDDTESDLRSALNSGDFKLVW